MNRFAVWRYSPAIFVVNLLLVVWNVVSAFRLHDFVYLVVAIWVGVVFQLCGQLQLAREQRDQARKDRADAVDAHFASLDRIAANLRQEKS